MTSEQKELTLVRLSSETVREATGRGWEEWLEALDAAGAADWNHGQIVAHLEREHREATTSWWRQSITVGYEQARGKRAEGETAAGFQVGVQRSVAASPAEAGSWSSRGPSCGWARGRRSPSRRASGTRCRRETALPARAARSGSSSPAPACA